ncbi:probable ATP-binding protein [Thermoplasma acidophilum]|uniref:Probable ATP-binding protein n=1 Tax=Thermoplasma acidophilum (strain ATCC 25905 / DSM 1728 / JCM 9062 / NBRC 15155 / AMRC-C165) TaxID=273075 RepID=Q9HLT2_THEAC|nr:ABC transporter ATP-binding protein [Thermoplasma acidophilum]CAC11290.1 probable ATP-binding protein [Thermoplasma acidophilum]
MTAKLELRNINKSYGKFKVISDLSLTIEKGEFFVILGPSGTGKSTLLKIIVGIEQPDSGKIIIDGKDVTKLPPNKRNIAMVFQNYALYPNMNVFDNIAFPLRMNHFRNISRRVHETAQKLGIENLLDKKVTQISGGQQQRVALARAIVRNPALFLLDEPLSNLDARVRYAARNELKKIQQELDQTFLFVTHDQKEAEALGDRIGVLHSGKFEQIGSYEELYNDPKTVWVGDFIGDYPMNFIGEKGFRPEWAIIEDEGEYIATVDSVETVGGTYFLHCVGPEDSSIILKSETKYNAGDKVSFSIKKYKTFEEAQNQVQ